MEHLVGAAQGCAASNGTNDDDCWRMTTTDGTQYYFGLNELPGWAAGNPVTNSAWTVPVFGNDAGEPCHAATFAASSCVQAWRWNLDYVVDPHGNAEALYYNQETNNYLRNGSTIATYTRGGQLDHIDYGLTSANVYAVNAASDRVVFGYDSFGRCSDATQANCTAESDSGFATAPAHPTSYPDIPFDQLCTGTSCPNLLSPSFFTTGMLDTVSTQYLNSGSYATVDVWTLAHSFPDPGDLTDAALWLTQVTHTGYSGSTSIAEPPTVFTGVTMQNRVWPTDGLAPLDKYRISSIQDTLGAVTSVNYANPDCTTANAAAIKASPQSNTMRCYPQWWTPDTVNPQPAQEDLFNKYVVTSTVSNPETGGGADAAIETDYVYTGTPAWRYDTSPFTPDSHRTWSVFAGYNTVEVRVGSSDTPAKQQTTAYTFYQGLDGDRAAPTGGTKSVAVTGYPGVADSLWLAGQTRDTKVLNGAGGTVVSDTVTTPWASPITANDGTITARIVNTGDVLTTEPLSAGGNRTTETVTTFDPSYGLPLTENAITSDAGTTCATTSYASPNTSAWLIDYPKETAKVGVNCASLAAAVYPDAAISDTRTSYDGQAWGTAPTKGDATSRQVVDSYGGTTAATAHWVTSAQTAYDAIGRPTSVTDVLGHTATTAYTPSATAAAGSGALTQQTVTNTAPFSWTTTTKFNPAWGVETSAADPNGNTTTATYDSLGRRTQVWLPIRPQAANPTSPSMAYAYTESTTVANTVTTTTIGPASNLVSYGLYDGLGRAVQTQTAADAGGGAQVSDTAYNTAGQVSYTNSPYWTTTNPSASLFIPTSESQVPSETATVYDGAGRATATILDSFGAEKSRTSTAYRGADRVDVTPPAGGTPTSSFTNALGQNAQLVQYLAATPSSTATQEATTYSYNPQGKMNGMTDPVGNHWSWSFDALGHQTSSDDPDTGTTTATFDNAGNLLTSTDGRGQTLTYTYDALNRKTAEYAGTSAATGSLIASWTYDTLKKGQLTSSTSYVGSSPGTPGAAYAEAITGYDASYNPSGTTVSIPNGAPAFGGTSYATSMSYDADGSLAMQTDPAEGGLPLEKIKYRYAATGKLLGLSGSAVVVGTIDYTPIGQVSQYARTGGTYTDYTNFGYDPATGATDQLLDTRYLGSDGTTGQLVADHRVTYDDAGEVTKQKTTADSVATDVQCYGYDHLQELTVAWTPATDDCSATPSTSSLGGPAPYWSDYTVDPATGNRTSTIQNPVTAGGATTSATYAYPVAGAANPHAVQSVTHTALPTDTYGYDGAGNTTTRPGQTLSYDQTGKLSTVTADGVTQSNIYDASGTLVMQSDPTNGTTLFLGDTELHVAAGTTSASAVRTYTANGTPVAERTTTVGVSGSMLDWLVTDQQNTTTAEINATTGTVTQRYSDPYGNSRGTVPTWSSPHGYLNAPTSTLSELTLLGAREYDSTLGRFLSVDSVLAPSNPMQNNGYSYSANNPVTLSDPTGLAPSDWLVSQPFHPPMLAASAAGNSSHSAGNTKATKSGSAAVKKIRAMSKAAGLVFSFVLQRDLDPLRYMVNAASSFGNAVSHHWDQLGAFGSGLALIVLGAAGEVGGGALDVTGVGALAGVPAGVASGAAIGAGAGLVGESITSLANEAAGSNRVEPWQNDSATAPSTDLSDLNFAKKVGLKSDSAAVQNRELSVNDFISQFRNAKVRGQVPGEYLDQTVGDALRSGNSTVRKLLTDGRWSK